MDGTLITEAQCEPELPSKKRVRLQIEFFFRRGQLCCFVAFWQATREAPALSAYETLPSHNRAYSPDLAFLNCSPGFFETPRKQRMPQNACTLFAPGTCIFSAQCASRKETQLAAPSAHTHDLIRQGHTMHGSLMPDCKPQPANQTKRAAGLLGGLLEAGKEELDVHQALLEEGSRHLQRT